MTRGWVRTFFLVWGVWTLFALLWTAREVLLGGDLGTDWRRSLLWNLFDWYARGSVTPLALWLTRRARPGSHSWMRVVGVHAVGIALFTVASACVYVYLARALALVLSLDKATTALVSKGIANVIVITGPFDAIIYAGIVAAAYAFDYSRRYRMRELQASQLETQLAQAQLQALKTQLQPHFLFNALNAISALVQKDPDAADRMIARLGDLLRQTLQMNGTQEVPLREELGLVEKYIDIQRTRFRERLQVIYSVAPETLDVPVPNLILQPLVENAIRHGISGRASGGVLKIRAARAGEELSIEVADDGCGFPALADAGMPEGVGLSNTRARLSRLYGGADRLSLSNGEEGGAVVRMSIPIRALESR